MIAILASLLLLAPQEDDSKRARDAALGLPGLAQAAPVPPPPDSGPTGTFMAPRVKRTVEDYKGLLDHNVFSPPRKKDAARDKPAADGSKPPEGPRIRKWVLTGIVYNSADRRYEALIEDSAAKESKFCKTGDTIAGATISEVTAEQVSYVKGESPGILKLTESLSETVAGGAAGSTPPSKPGEEGEIEKARERLKKRHKRETVPDEVEEEAEKDKKPK